jgi:hypothetical protein
MESTDEMDVCHPDLATAVDANRFVADVRWISKQLEWFFDGFANGGACALIHASFARALATPTSDVNLYIAPYTRAELDGLWCLSFNRDFETIEDCLQDLLKRPVTVSCHLDPRFWIKSEEMFMVWPSYEWVIPKKACTEKLPFLENLLRKCWCEVSWQEICSSNKETCPVVGDNLRAVAGAKRRKKGVSPRPSISGIISAIRKIDAILQSASVADWKLVEPTVPSILQLCEEISKLAKEVFGLTGEEQYREWDGVIEWYQDCAACILELGTIVMPNVVKDVEESEEEGEINPIIKRRRTS